MPRPEQKFVTFEIDGREVSAPEGSMLADGAKYGDNGALTLTTNYTVGVPDLAPERAKVTADTRATSFIRP